MKIMSVAFLTAAALLLCRWGFSRPPAIVFAVTTQACAKPVSGIKLDELAALLKKRGKKVTSVDAASSCVNFEHIIEKRTIDGAAEGVEQ